MNSRQHRAVTSARRETNEVSPRGTPICCLQRGVSAPHGQGDNSTMPGVLTELRTGVHGVGAGTKRPGSAWKGKGEEKAKTGRSSDQERAVLVSLAEYQSVCV